MNKIGQVTLVIVAVIVLYLIMLVVMPLVSDMASTANTTMAASSNLSNYPGATEGIMAAPWVLWFVPGCIGMILIVVILK